jgi:hypothetical protein
MSQFIDPINQMLLWKTLNKHPFISNAFPITDSNATRNKKNWFKKSISEIYSDIQNHTFTKDELLTLNKNSLRKMIEPFSPSTNQNLKSSSSISEIDTNSYSRESILQNKTDEFQRNLQHRQSEYEQLYQKTTPPPVQFESTNDDVIQNMDELLQKQLREREEDLKLLNNPLSNNSQIQSPSLPSIPSKINTTLTIEPDSDIKIDILEIPAPNKKVSWDMTNAIESKMEELTKNYLLLLQFLESRIPNFQNEFSQFSLQNSQMMEESESS